MMKVITLFNCNDWMRFHCRNDGVCGSSFSGIFL